MMDPAIVAFLTITATSDKVKEALILFRDQLNKDRTKNPLQMDVGYSLFVLAIDVFDMDHTLFPYHRIAGSTLAQSIKNKAVVAMAAYAAFVLMHDEGIEMALAELPIDPVLEPFRDFFRSSAAHHLRNAIRTGSFWIEDKLLSFTDDGWSVSMQIDDFLRLCNHIRRFYEPLS